MNLLENPKSYNLSESKFSLAVAIFDVQSKEFVELKYLPGLLLTQTQIGNGLDSKSFYFDYKPCNSTNGDFGEIAYRDQGVFP